MIDVEALASLISGDASAQIIADAAASFLEETGCRGAQFHPVGFVKVPLTDDADRRLSIHIWHPVIQQPQVPPHVCHAHGWSLSSTVLAGQVSDHRYEVTEDPNGSHFIYGVRYEPGASVSFRLPGRVQADHRDHRTYSAGDHYGMPADAFHRSDLPDAVAVTAIRSGDGSPAGAVNVRGDESPEELRYERSPVEESLLARLTKDACDAIRSSF